jgi:hypothetical protein
MIELQGGLRKISIFMVSLVNAYFSLSPFSLLSSLKMRKEI